MSGLCDYNWKTDIKVLLKLLKDCRVIVRINGHLGEAFIDMDGEYNYNTPHEDGWFLSKDEFVKDMKTFEFVEYLIPENWEGEIE